MKAFAVILLVASVWLVAGCESDMPPEPNRENPLQRGLRGEGKITERDYSNDPYVRDEPRSNY